MNATHRDPRATPLEAFAWAVDMNDVVDPDTSLPESIPLDCDAQQMHACFTLCLHFWEQGADRMALRRYIDRLLTLGTLSNEERVHYKQIRASYKQLRFAFANYERRHRSPMLFRLTVVALGHLQDALRNRRRAATLRYALLLRVLVSRVGWALIRREVECARLDDAAGFLAFRQAEMARLRRWLDQRELSAHTFHNMRKVVSRQVSHYDALRTLTGREDAYRMSRFLSAINGLMGSLHDELVLQSVKGQRDYDRDTVLVPEDIRKRIAALVTRYPASPA
ncbi:hypothetical protein MTR62_11280 [Novosphingobium sp. 1949]|uniref:CHAD domain-containing protein n=1 Tax=Novosphingobium organovorum TaxID=2930092 RepID=A0ABT0BDY5_9SPHN|nr:hypothetical protein [Novosphingobium organovorum]MCJ2183268.1 hypothetical protein [Novosphingobium organovorum]